MGQKILSIQDVALAVIPLWALLTLLVTSETANPIALWSISIALPTLIEVSSVYYLGRLKYFDFKISFYYLGTALLVANAVIPFLWVGGFIPALSLSGITPDFIVWFFFIPFILELPVIGLFAKVGSKASITQALMSSVKISFIANAFGCAYFAAFYLIVDSIIMGS